MRGHPVTAGSVLCKLRRNRVGSQQFRMSLRCLHDVLRIISRVPGSESSVSVGLPLVACSLPLTACCQWLAAAASRLPLTACFSSLELTACRLQLAACRLPLPACGLPLAACRLPFAACRLPLAACRLLHAAGHGVFIQCGFDGFPAPTDFRSGVRG